MSTCVGCHGELETTATFCPRCGTPNPDAVTQTPTEGESASLLPPLDAGQFRARLQAALGRDFSVGDVVGEGGFAVVFGVQDKKLSRRIAVKVLRPELAVSRHTVQRFIREAESAASLSHPHVLPIFFVGEGEGLVYFGMPFVEGETLDQRLAREGRLPEAEVARIGADVADALADAHARGLVHRDVKPANILLQAPRGRVLVADFGIAKAASGSGNKLTGTGSVIGSPHYMSPEQASGSGNVDWRSDVYSLGVVLFQMLAGELPFEAPDTQGILLKHLTQPLPSLAKIRSGVSPVLVKVIERCCRKAPEDRFQSVAEVAEALRTGKLAAAPRPLPVRRSLLVAAAAVALVGGSLLMWSQLTSGPAAPSGGGNGGAGPAATRSLAPRLAILPFEVSGISDTGWARQTAISLANSIEERFAVPTVDINRVLDRWTAERRSLRPIDSSAAFAYRMEANQLIVGNIIAAGRQVRVTADVYDTHTYARLGRGEMDGSQDSLIAVLDRLAGRVAQLLCRQPRFNPRNLCFETAARPAAPIAISYQPTASGAAPESLVLDVLVGASGQVGEVKPMEEVSADLLSAALPAIRGARYLPARRGTGAVESWTTVSVSLRRARVADSTRTPATTAAASASGDCVTQAVSLANPGRSCYDSRPVPRSMPAAVPPASCGRVGAAQVIVRVSAAGEVVGDPKVLAPSGCEQFDLLVAAQLLDMTFQPAMRNGVAVDAWVVVVMRAIPAGRSS